MIADQRTRDRLAKICGLFGSDQLGERAAAAMRADAILRQAGLSWADLFAGAAVPPMRPAPPPFDPHSATPPVLLAQCAPVLTAWEQEFLASIGSRRGYTVRQADRLGVIRAKCVAWWTNGGQA